MKLKLFAAAAIATWAVAAQAGAAVTVTWGAPVNDATTLPPGEQLIADFQAGAVVLPNTLGAALTVSGATVGVNEGGSGYSGTIPNTDQPYLTIPGGTSATFTFGKLIKHFSFYAGSPDTYNSLAVYKGVSQVAGSPFAGGNLFPNPAVYTTWDYGRRVEVTISGGADKFVFGSTGNSFELDNVAAGVPESATWALMIGGFGGAGAMLRRRRAVA